jgi:phosphotransferase system HPr (HPr) family protein
MSDVVTASVTVNGENGLHLVPCSLIAQNAARYSSDLTISKGPKTVDAKNIFDLMSLGAGKGVELMVSACGDDAAAAIETLTELFEAGFPTPTET